MNPTAGGASSSTAAGGGWQPQQQQQQHQDPTTTSMADDDFSSFLDLGEFSLNFPAFDQESGVGADATGQDGAVAGDAMDFDYENVGQAAPPRQPHQQLQQMGLKQPPQGGVAFNGEGTHPTAEPVAKHPFDLNMDAQLFYDSYERQTREPDFGTQPIIPPTPNSIEMHGGAARYYQQLDSQQQQQQILADRYQRRKDDQMIFTPLVSPAVTPLDTQFALPEYAVPGAYLSPLTSPALEAQNAASRRATYGGVGRPPPSTATPSPSEMHMDMASMGPAGPAKKSRRKLSNARPPPARVVRQSPSMKPQRKKPASTSAANIKLPAAMDLPELADGKHPAAEARSNPSAMARVPPANHDSSGADSVSPESLSEALMGPPPAPRSAPPSGQTPLATAPAEGANGNGNTNSELHPATPASLMRLQKGAGGDAAQQRDVAQHPGPGVSPVIASNQEEQPTPTIAAKRTPNLRPLSAAGPSTAPSSAGISPAFSELGSPSGPVAASKTADGKTTANGTGRGSGKKRNGTTSVQASPALRPRISPSIKPLLPDGAAVSAETSALLLASKSNYQNILEGNHLPGVSYPETLSSNLTSKRTSHKLAEQGRRNRINIALQELAGLLPTDKAAVAAAGGSASASGSVDGDAAAAAAVAAGGNSTAAQQSNSKASTVEMAIEYIRDLQAQLAETREKLEVAEETTKELDPTSKADPQGTESTTVVTSDTSDDK